MRMDNFDEYINQKKIFELNLLPPHKYEEEEEEDDDDDDGNAPDWYDQERTYHNRISGPGGLRKRIPGKNVFVDGLADEIFLDQGDGFDELPMTNSQVYKFGFDSMFANAHYDVKNLAVTINQLIETNRSFEIMDNETGKIFKFEKNIEVVGLLKREGYMNKKFDYDCILVRELSDNSMYVFSTETDNEDKAKFSFIFKKY